MGLDCININTPGAKVHISKAFGSMIYIICYHVVKHMPLIDSITPAVMAECCIEIMIEEIGRDSVKYMEYTSVNDAVSTYLESCQWLVKHDISERRELLANFMLITFPVTPAYDNPYCLDDEAVRIRGKNCLAFINDPLELSRDEVYATISGVDEALYLRLSGMTEKLEWQNRGISQPPRRDFISMLYPDIVHSENPFIQELTQ